MSKRKCVNCGKDPAEGFASVGRMVDGKWVESYYCHGDDDDVSCYESRDWAEALEVIAEVVEIGEAARAELSRKP